MVNDELLEEQQDILTNLLDQEPVAELPRILVPGGLFQFIAAYFESYFFWVGQFLGGRSLL